MKGDVADSRDIGSVCSCTITHMLCTVVCLALYAELPASPRILRTQRSKQAALPEDTACAAQQLLRSLISTCIAQREHLDRMLGRGRQLSGRLESMSSLGSIGESNPCLDYKKQEHHVMTFSQ